MPSDLYEWLALIIITAASMTLAITVVEFFRLVFSNA